MAYNTAYTLKTYKSDRHISDILSQVKKSDFDEMFFAIDGDGRTNNKCAWYEHERDMIKLSILFPDIVFDLCGDGADPGDIWRKYFLNGKVQRCNAKITFDEFDSRKLNGEEGV